MRALANDGEQAFSCHVGEAAADLVGVDGGASGTAGLAELVDGRGAVSGDVPEDSLAA